MTTTDVDNWPADVDGVQGPELMQRFLKHAERFETEIVFDHINEVDFKPAAVHPQGRLRHLHLRRADHRHRRLGQVPRAAVGAGVHGARRLGLRHLRRLLLPRPGRAVIGGGNTAVEEALYLSNIAQQGAPGAPARQVPGRDDPVDKLMEKVRARQRSTLACDHAGRGAGRRSRASPACASSSTKAGSTEELAVRALHRHRPQAEHRDLQGPVEMKDGYILTRGGLEGVATATSVPGCSPRATCRTTSTGRRSPAPAPAAWRRWTPSDTSKARRLTTRASSRQDDVPL